MDKTSMLESLIGYYTDGNKAQFAVLLGVKPQTISAWISRNTFDAELIYAHCRDVSADWLLSGEGDMLRSSHTAIANGDSSIAYSIGVPIDVIGQAMGHSQRRVTEIYIAKDQTRVDEANRRVIDWVLYGKK